MGEPNNNVMIYRPTITSQDNKTKITYRFNNKFETAVFETGKNKGNYPQGGVAVDFAKGFREYAFKDKNVNKGNITRKDALNIIKNIFTNNSETRIQSGWGTGGALSEAKDLFDIYTDRDSDGGEMITQKEQGEIMHLYGLKYGTIKKED